VPAEYAALFAGAEAVLDSHRGLDYGARDVAVAFGKHLGVEPAIATTSRLVVDLNRSLGHRTLFSEYMRPLTREQRAAALEKHYRPYRADVETRVARATAAGALVLHVSAHSFTPELHGEVRNCDVGLLYDPRRRYERALMDAWHDALRARAPELRVRRNYPYLGVADSLVTYLRRRHGERSYAGVELEVNQKHVQTPAWRKLVAALAVTLEDALGAI
jgi:predicted N-formylglutamate amidohydrolase